ncbi:MAG TPA: hypothetical protein VH637_22220 [Streptosporangiaceae bacterium]
MPLSIWPAVPAPGRCPASPGQTLCPQRLDTTAAAMITTAFTAPGDLVVVIPGPGTSALLAAARAGRRALALAASPRHNRDLAALLDNGLDPAVRPLARVRPGGPAAFLDGSCREAGQAALAITAACATPGCPPPGGDADPRTDPGVLYAACQRALRPGGLLAVITAAARQPGWPGQVIAHARAAGLIYAQHIIALHAPIRGSRLHPPDPGAPALPQLAAAMAGRHLPAHSDLLVFAAPGHD